MNVHPSIIPAIEAWLRAGQGDTLNVMEPVDVEMPSTVDEVVSVAIPPPLQVLRQAVRFPRRDDGEGQGWTLWVAVDAATGEPVAVTHTPEWRTW